jgi:Uma2 family endonuclease
MSLQLKPHLSFEDWLESERVAQDERCEFVNGEVFAMSGGSAEHHTIISNINRLYRRIPSLSDYLLVAQNRVSVELYSRGEDGRWILSAHEDLDARVTLPSIGCELALAEVYEKIAL